MSDIANAALGSCRITYGSQNLGWTTEEGVMISFDGHKFVPLKVDEYGVTPLDQFDVGIEKFFLKFGLLELSDENLRQLSPFAVLIPGDNMITEGGVPTGSSASKHKTLNIHPRRLPDTDLSLDIDVHKILLQLKGDYGQGVENVQNYPAEGEAVLDTGKSPGNQLYSMGGITS